MNCALCNGNIVKKNSFLLFKSKTLGDVTIPSIDFEECEFCRDILLSPESSKKALSYVRQKEQDAINKMPIDDFITAAEAVDILGITKQAFSKNPKIKRGLIYSVKKGRSKFFLKKSVKLFKEKNNGKFLLSQHEGYGQEESTELRHRYATVIHVHVEAPFTRTTSDPATYTVDNEQPQPWKH